MPSTTASFAALVSEDGTLTWARRMEELRAA